MPLRLSETAGDAGGGPRGETWASSTTIDDACAAMREGETWIMVFCVGSGVVAWLLVGSDSTSGGCTFAGGGGRVRLQIPKDA